MAGTTDEVAPVLTLRPAVVADVDRILDLVNDLAAAGEMLPRSPAATVERLRDFVVAEVDGEFAGCAALAIIWSDIGEIRSIAVHQRFRKYGLGRQMVQALLAEANRMGIARVMAFTYVVEFFTKLGFRIVDHAALPHKVFNDCLNCPKFHKCDEIAVVKELDAAGETPDLGPLSLPMPGRHHPHNPRKPTPPLEA